MEMEYYHSNNLQEKQTNFLGSLMKLQVTNSWDHGSYTKNQLNINGWLDIET